MSRQNKLILKKIGLCNPTMVELNGRILATQGLDIETLCSMWRQYFGTAIAFGRVDLYVEKERDFNAIQQRALAHSKSVMELLAERGFYCVLLPKDEEKGDWEICSTRELAQKDNETEELKSALVGVKKERDELRARLKELKGENGDVK